jgi:hypothetical protein
LVIHFPFWVKRRAWSIPADQYGQRFLEAAILENADLLIEGQDLGHNLPFPGLPGVTEYECAWRIAASEIDALVQALGGAPGDDVLALLLAAFPDSPSALLGPFFEEHKIVASFWNHFSD